MKHPIEIELTDFCSLQCESCVNPLLQNKGFISNKIYEDILEYIFQNKENILFINFSWIWDIFLHPKIIFLFDIFISKFKNTWIKVLIPTKWQSVKKDYFEIFEKMRKNGIYFNISVWLYSIRKDFYNRLTKSNTFDITMRFIKKLKKQNISFSLELLINKNTISEIPLFKKLANLLEVWYSLQWYHNFAGHNKILESLGNNCTFSEDDNYWFKDFFCYFIPLFDSKWNIYTCSISWKNKNFLVWNISDLFVEFPKYTKLMDFIKSDFLSKDKCKNCSIYKNYERKNIIWNNCF